MATKNGSAASLNIDGVDVTGTVTAQTLANTTTPLRVGFDGTSTYFLGSIDEVAVYKTALSPAQVLTRYKLGVNTIANTTRYYYWEGSQLGTRRVGEECLRDGSWPIVGAVAPWSRDKWPMPPFAAGLPRALPTGQVTQYSDDCLEEAVRTWSVSPTEAERYPRDEFGHGHAAVIELRRILLCDGSASEPPACEPTRSSTRTTEVRLFLGLDGSSDMTGLVARLGRLGWTVEAAKLGDDIVASKEIHDLDSYRRGLIERMTKVAVEHKARIEGWEYEVPHP